ncbi:hypothetical protein HS088_TW13G01232 [Tripterygium wilfordii]|uniref:Uncharacterized protein n=1 Tax=Tripterygium wilfordii TaxID=458696 RepID=A0A7J7CW30_TRIWF|nr:(S)-scoulerine 9-O-methyltransferase-like [Tripterygium wilfordii]KAF5738335.1 hypothetical protein HS088_TW13G01232 [Tripterygium wilfordii]
MGSQEDDDFLSAFGITRMIGVQLALRAAVELNVFTIIANSNSPEAQLTAKEIVAKIPTTNPNAAMALEKILNLLASYSILSASPRTSLSDGKRPEKAYGLTKQSRRLALDNGGVSLASVLLFGSEREIVDSFYTLKDAVLEQSYKGYNKANGETFFESLRRKPGLNKLFNDNMSICSKVMLEQVLRVYRGFEEVEELMDVGGGIGTSLEKIVSAYPHIHGINMDLPHVIANATTIAGVKHIAGDMFEPLPAAQTIFLKWVLHDWDDDWCIKILRNCWKALPENGKVIVVEFAVSEDCNESVHTTFMELMMMVLNLGGKERTTVELDWIAKAAGFAQTITFPTHKLGFYVIEFIKKT